MSKQFALFGHPVTHTLSPRIHRAFARDLGIDMEYRAVDTAPDDFKAALDRFAEAGGVGGNVTLPLKEAAFGLCADLSPAARRAQSVNTLIRTDHGWHGENTDGAGLVRDLTDRHRLDLRGRRTLLLGAGGAARGVAPALLEAGIDKMVVVNRSAERADRLVDLLDAPGRVASRYWEDLEALGDFELVINATSATRHGGALKLPFGLASPRFVVVDLNYGEAAAPFLSWGRAAKAEAAIDGLGMLVEQAAEAFQRWHGRRPDTDDLYASLRAEHARLQTAD
ncbi:shikimate dehydrogenase [Pseudomarimonas salicorniae]|uniref:Shikimate dehydrogenase (NADP(+)) n=1 Tax=Pseudomarimonas salicorniae TaxID=2933270 RepID=A0ABT0GI57_9GAMM|nr:shikimate dehydrogenase [Lysobacter sp. CAU 1642]MCK7594232.1 shikimate dehydrogenase [Lysobacter sp. CAU 1642]